MNHYHDAAIAEEEGTQRTVAAWSAVMPAWFNTHESKAILANIVREDGFIVLPFSINNERERLVG